MRRKILIILFAALFLAAGLLVYLNHTYFPGPFRDRLTTHLEARLKRPVTVGAVYFVPSKGFVLKHLTVRDKAPGAPPVFSARELSAHVIPLGFGRQPRLLVYRLLIRGPFIRLHRDSAGEWNVRELLENLSPSGGRPAWRVRLAGGRIIAGEAEVTDDVPSPSVTQNARDVRARFGLTARQGLHLRLEGALEGDQKTVPVWIAGQFHFPGQTFKGHARLRGLPIGGYWRAYSPRGGPSIDRGVLARARCDILYENGVWHFNGEADVRGLVLRIRDREFRGDPGLDFALRLDPSADKKLLYKGSAVLRDASLSGLPRFDTVKHIRGTVDFKTGRMTSSRIDAQTAEGIPFTLRGVWRFLPDPFVSVKIECSTALENVLLRYPELANRWQVSASGPSTWRVGFRGRPGDYKNANWQCLLSLDGAQLRLPRLPRPLSNVSGKLRLAPGRIAWEEISADYDNNPLRTNGTIEGKDTRRAGFSLTADDLDLGTLSELARHLWPEIQYTAAGRADAVIRWDGGLGGSVRQNLTFRADLKNALITDPAADITVHGLNGHIHFAKDILTWKDLKGVFRDKAFLTNGSLSGLRDPLVSLSVNTDILSGKAEFKVSDKDLAFHSAAGRWRNSRFELKGRIRRPLNRQSRLVISGQCDLDMKDLTALLPARRRQIESLRPEGRVIFNGSLEGNITDWRGCLISAKGQSGDLTLKDQRFRSVDVEIEQGGRRLKALEITAGWLGGTLDTVLSADWKDPSLPASIEARLADIDLEGLKETAFAKGKDIAGRLSLQFTGSSPLRDLKKLEGNGRIDIKEGRLWEMNLLKGLGQFLFIPEFRDIVFKEASGTFRVDKQRVVTHDLVLTSDPVVFLCRGWANFEGRLSFGIFSRFSREAIARSSSLKKIFTSIVTSSDDYLTIRLTGTLQRPRYLVVPASVDLLRRTTDMLMKGIYNIFE